MTKKIFCNKGINSYAHVKIAYLMHDRKSSIQVRSIIVFFAFRLTFLKLKKRLIELSYTSTGVKVMVK